MRCTKVYIFISLLVIKIFYFEGSAQQSLQTKQDSLLGLLERFNKKDTNYVNTLLNLGKNIQNQDIDQAIVYYSESLALSQEIGEPATRQQILSHNSLGISYGRQGQYEESIYYFQQALELAESVNDPHNIANNHNNLGIVYRIMGDYPRSIFHYKEALKRDEIKNDSSGIATVCANLGALFVFMEEPQEAERYFQRAYDIRLAIGETHKSVALYSNIAFIYLESEQFDRALPLFEKALAEYEENDDLANASLMRMNLGNIYFQQAKFREAESLIKQAMQEADRLKLGERQVSSRCHLVSVKVELRQYEEAERLAREAITLAQSLDLLPSKADAYRAAAIAAEAKGDYVTALSFHRKHKEFSDSIFNASASKAFKNQQVIMQVEAKDRQLEAQASEVSSLNQQVSYEKRWKWMLLFVSVLLFIIGALFYQKYVQRRKYAEEMEQKNEQIASQKEELKKLNQMKSHFFANISHEFRTPLTLILGPTEQLLTQFPHGKEHQKLNWIYRNGQKLQKLINQLLDLSKIEAGKLTLQCSQQDIVKFSHRICSAFESLAQQRHIHLKPPKRTEPLYVYFDAPKLEQVLNNLLNNAFKFTEEGFISLQVEEITQNDTSYASIILSDSGMGIHADQLPFIFERFFQADQDEKTAFEGTGIGLSLCKELVDLHFGKIEVDSEQGKGTRFRILIPMGRAHLADEHISPLTDSSERVQHVPSSAFTDSSLPLPEIQLANPKELPLTLIIDDNKDILDYLHSELLAKHRLLVATNGEEGWELVLKELPDLVISDIMMPVLNGLELCKKIKQDIRTDHIPVMLLTARMGEDQKIEGYRTRADAYVQKPFNITELSVIAQNLIDGRKILRKRYTDQVIFSASEIANDTLEEQFLKRLTEVIEAHLTDSRFDVNTLCNELGMSKSQLNRKMKAVLGKSPNQYIRSYKLEKARQILKQTDLTVAEVAYDVGFSSPAYFSKCFHDEFGYSPSNLQ